VLPIILIFHEYVFIYLASSPVPCRNIAKQTPLWYCTIMTDWLTGSKAYRSNPYVLIYLCFRIKVLISRSGFSEVESRVLKKCGIKKINLSTFFFPPTQKRSLRGLTFQTAVFVWLLFVHLRYVIQIIGAVVFTAYCTCQCARRCLHVCTMSSCGWNIFFLPCGWVQYKSLCFLIGLSDFCNLWSDLNICAGHCL